MDASGELGGGHWAENALKKNENKQEIISLLSEAAKLAPNSKSRTGLVIKT